MTCCCGGKIVELDVSACADSSRPARQCTKCLTNDGDRKLGGYVMDLRCWVSDRGFSLAILLFVERSGGYP